MFQLYYEKTYIIVVPTFKETLVHRHNMLHVFFGNGALQLSAGDIILYLGNQITIYYDKNSWNFTCLGKVDGIIQETTSK